MRQYELTKGILFLSFIGLVFWAVGCKKIDKLTQFNLDYTSTVTIPSSVGVNVPFTTSTPDVKTNSTTKFSNNNTHKDKIEEIILTDVVMTITQPIGEDFSFMKQIKLFISSPNHAERRIAWKKDICMTTCTDKIKLDVTGIDLKNYLKEDTFSLRVEVVTDETILSDYDIEVYTNFYVDAKVL